MLKVFFIFLCLYLNKGEILLGNEQDTIQENVDENDRQMRNSQEFEKQQILNKNNYDQLKAALAFFRRQQIKKEKDFEYEFEEMQERTEKRNKQHSESDMMDFQKLFEDQKKTANESILKIRKFLRNKTSKFDHEKEFDWEFLEKLIDRDPELDYPTYNDDNEKN